MTTQLMSTAPARRIAGYVRVSSKEQAEDQNALEQQKARVRDAGATEIYEDVLSGRRDDRPQYQRLMELVKNREVDEVVFTRIDRLTRSIAELSRCIEIFEASDVNLRILDQNLDLRHPTGKLMARLLGAVAEWESDLISERVRHGKAYRRKLQMACESAPRGYVVVDDHYQLNTTPIFCLLNDRPDDYMTFTENTPVEQVETGTTVADLARELVEIFLETKTTRATLQRFYERYDFYANDGSEEFRETSPEVASQSSPPAGDDAGRKPSKPQRSKEKDWTQTILYWTESGLRNWLTNPVLEGNTAYRKWIQEGKNRRRSSEPPQIIKDTHPDEALITHDEAAYIRETIEIHKKMGGGSFIPGGQSGDASQYRPYAHLNALVHCYTCGTQCRTKSSCKGKYLYFLCPHAGIKCKNKKSAPKDKVEQALIKHLVLRSQQMRAAIRDAKRPQTNLALMQLMLERASLELLSEEQPSEEQPSEEQPSEEQPSEEQPSEEQPSEEQPSEEQPSEEQPSEKQRLEEQRLKKQRLEEQLAEFHRQNQPQYRDLLSIDEQEVSKSERLQSLEEQLQYLEGFPGFNPQNEALKEQLRQDIEREQLQSSSLLNKSAEEIIFAGNEGIFWNGLTLDQKVDIYPRIVDRIYIHNGLVKQVNLKVQIPEKEDN